MSAVYGVCGESDVTNIDPYFFRIALSCITLPGKPQREKPRFRAKPGKQPSSDELKASLFLEALSLTHGPLPSDDNRICVMNNTITDCICQYGVSQLIPPSRDIYSP